MEFLPDLEKYVLFFLPLGVVHMAGHLNWISQPSVLYSLFKTVSQYRCDQYVGENQFPWYLLRGTIFKNLRKWCVDFNKDNVHVQTVLFTLWRYSCFRKSSTASWSSIKLIKSDRHTDSFLWPLLPVTLTFRLQFSSLLVFDGPWSLQITH